jgi:hypothetical protein
MGSASFGMPDVFGEITGRCTFRGSIVVEGNQEVTGHGVHDS